MKVFLDANYIIYLKYSESDEIFNYCTNLLRKLKGCDLLVNIAVINEVVWVLRRKYGIELEEIFEFLDKFLSFVKVVPLETEDYELMKELMLRYNLKPSDSLHVASMKRFGAKFIVSEDPDFDKIEWIERIWIDKGDLGNKS